MKIAIVTGASSGIGREFVTQISRRFGGLGEIWVIARRKDRLEELADGVSIKLRIFSMDLQEVSALEQLRQALETEKPDVKILVNSAGYGKIGAVGKVDLMEETGMISLNCQALCAVTHLVLPYMSQNSRMIQLASSAAFLPQPRFAVYAASKAFVLSYSRALREELRPRRISVTAVCPGPVKTEFFDVAETGGEIPLYKRMFMADPKKVAALALRDAMGGKSVSVYGLLMKGFRVASKLLPHELIIRIANRYL